MNLKYEARLPSKFCPQEGVVVGQTHSYMSQPLESTPVTVSVSGAGQEGGSGQGEQQSHLTVIVLTMRLTN